MDSNTNVEVHQDGAGKSVHQQRAGTRYDIPAANIYERDDAYVLMMDLPGVRMDAICLNLSGETMALRADVAAQHPEEARVLSAEILSSGYVRSFRLGADIDGSGIQARYELGVLTVVLPKRDTARTKEIPIH